MNNKGDISIMMGSAYITLAVISLIADLPIKVTNSVALGALSFSVSEVLVLLNNRKIRKRSFVDVLKGTESNNKGSMAFRYVKELLNERQSELSAQTTVLSFISIFFKTLALFCVVVFPFVPSLPLFETSKFGVFCTVVSMGIIFLSFHFANRKESEKYFDDIGELMDCFGIVLDEMTESEKNVVEKLGVLEQKNNVKKNKEM